MRKFFLFSAQIDVCLSSTRTPEPIYQNPEPFCQINKNVNSKRSCIIENEVFMMLVSSQFTVLCSGKQ